MYIGRSARGGEKLLNNQIALIISRECLVIWLLIFLIFNIYAELPLDLGEGKVLPAFPYVFSIPFLSIWIRKWLTRYDWMLVCQVVTVLMASILFSAGMVYWLHKLIGVAQTSVSIIGGILLFRLVTSVTTRSVEKVFLFVWVVLLAGSLLELVGLLKDASDLFREWAYNAGGYVAYNNDARDLEMTGVIRPKFFSSEPSLLAIGYMVFVNSWFILRPLHKRLLTVLLSSIAAIFIIGSPIIYLSIFVTVTISLRVMKTGRSLFLGGVVFVSILVVSAISSEDNLIAKRFNSDSIGEDVGTNRSENIRLYLPYLTAAAVIKESPFFGAGISGKEAASDIVSLPNIEPVFLLGNNVAALLIYLGIAGTVLLMYFMCRYMWYSGIRSIGYTLFFWFCLGQTMGGFESSRFWGYMFLFAGAVYHADKMGAYSSSQKVI